jgi:hypothetical protein
MLASDLRPLGPGPLALAGLVAGIGSFGTVQKYAGAAAALAFVVVATIAVPLVWPYLDAAAERLLPGRRGVVAAVLVLLCFLVALAIVYPHADTHAAGQGSDRDDSVNVGGLRLLHGEYPYSARTYLGLPIAQMPGALLLASPFAAVASSAWANVLWLAVLVLLIASTRAPGVAAVAVAAAFVVAPALPREYLTGGDLVANTIYVLAAVWLAYRFAGGRLWIPVALALGLTLASRSNFAFVLLPLVFALQRRHGTLVAARTVGLAIVAALALTLPFVVPQDGWDALVSSNRLAPLGRAGEAAVLAATVGLALWLALRERRWSFQAVVWQAALVQGVFPLVLLLQASASAGRLDGEPLVSGYGVPAALLALAGVSMRRADARGLLSYSRADAVGRRAGLQRGGDPS